VNSRDERELAALSVLENKLKDSRDNIVAQLEPVRVRINELIRLKRMAMK
jgi:hypothetical protein